MKEISFVFSIKGNAKSQKISLCGHLEALIGNYYLSQAGNPKAAWYGIHYDASINVDLECVDFRLSSYFQKIGKNAAI